LPAKIVNLFLPNTIFMDEAEFMPNASFGDS